MSFLEMIFPNTESTQNKDSVPKKASLEDLEKALRRLLRKVHLKAHHVPKSLLRELKKLVKDKLFHVALWKLTHCLDFSEFQRDEVLVKQLLQTWELAISFQESHLGNEDEDEIAQEGKKRALAFCRKGQRRTLLILKETQVLDMLYERTIKLLLKMDELSLKRYHEIKRDILQSYYVDALWKLTKSEPVLKVENRLRMLKEVWEYLYEYEQYRALRIEEICRALHSRGEQTDKAQMILDQKRHDVANCKEGLRQATAHLEALLESNRLPWWPWSKN